MRTYAWVSQYTEGRCISFRSKLKNAYCLKWLFTQKCYFFVGFPPSVQYFFVKWTLFVPFLHIFDRFCGFLIQRGTNCAIFNLNNWRLERLKVHVIFQTKKVLYWKYLAGFGPYIDFTTKWSLWPYVFDKKKESS